MSKVNLRQSPFTAALICYLIAAVATLGVGLVYSLSSRIMPYHEAALGQAWETLSRPTQILLLALLRGAGGAATAAATALLLLILIPFRQGHPWARWAIPLVGLMGYLPLLYVVVVIKTQTPASPPLAAVLVVTALWGAGAVLAPPPWRRKPLA